MTPTPPPAEGFAARLIAGPALRCQPDGRLVTLVRDGNEPAFEEIVRRYGKALQRYAAAIVSHQRAEDVTQDAFTKAFVALRGSEKEIKLRPWLYRIVRNTALNELRDAPPAAAELDERAVGGEEPAEAIERRERIEGLMAGLAELPEPQRAAIVMRELEGLSHEQIAKSLGVSGGSVRQSIYRARTALRDGVGMLVPLPLLRLLSSAMSPDAATSAAAAGGTGVGLGMAAKAGIATLLVAGTATAGVAIEQHHQAAAEGAAAAAVDRGSDVSGGAALTAGDDSGDSRGPGGGGDGRRGHSGGGDSGPGTSGSGHDGSGTSGSSGSSGSGSSGSGSGSSGPGPSGSGSSGSGSDSSGSGSSGPGPGTSGSGSSGPGSGTSGSGISGSGSSGSGSGSDDLLTP